MIDKNTMVDVLAEMGLENDEPCVIFDKIDYTDTQDFAKVLFKGSAADCLQFIDDAVEDEDTNIIMATMEEFDSHQPIEQHVH